MRREARTKLLSRPGSPSFWVKPLKARETGFEPGVER
jgi:hypothetical protein